jgi:hypothetical protein
MSVSKKQIEDLKRIQYQLETIKKAEAKARRDLALELLDLCEFGEAQKEKFELHGYKITVETSESLEILDKEALLDIALYSMADMTDAEKAFLKLKVDPTVAKAKKLPEGSVLLDLVMFKPSPTPTVKIEAL